MGQYVEPPMSIMNERRPKRKKEAKMAPSQVGRRKRGNGGGAVSIAAKGALSCRNEEEQKRK